MGLLDDAIREHLELKRQRGADDDEVSRLERDALGPVVRGDEYVTDATSAGDESLSPEYEPMGAGEAAAAEYDHPLSDVEPALEQEPLAPEPGPVEPEPSQPEVREHVGQPTEEFDVESAHAQEALRSAAPEPDPASPAPASHEPPPPDPAPPAPEPAHDGHDAQRPAKTGEHDVLEETPEFLQETPEHDRLWFEQGPPQEFDFDK
jgi:hypothetical protein